MSEENDKAREEIAELACSRAAALGKGVVVAGFTGSGKAQVFDVEMREGELELVPVDTVPITPDQDEEP
jgi:hypothetical protein